MNKFTRLIGLCALMAMLALFSCTGDDSAPIQPDFSIISNEYMEVLETYDNGWIKSAIKYNSAQEVTHELLYHENGRLANIKIYNSYPGEGLYMEHSRDEHDQPLATTLYDLQGDIYFTITYNNALPESSSVYMSDNEIRMSYTDGAIESAEKYNSENDLVKRIVTDNINQTRTISILQDGSVVKEVTTAINGNLETGFNSYDHQFVAAIADDEYDTRSISLAQSRFSSLSKKYTFDFNELIPTTDYINISDEMTERFGYNFKAVEAMNFVTNPFYRNMIEQYSYIETAYIGESIYLEDQISLDFPVSESLNTIDSLKAAHGDYFTELYGHQYSNNVINGKLVYYVINLRNLPSDDVLKDQLVEIARKYYRDIIDNTSLTSEDERAMLDNVFHELKVHSNIAEQLQGHVIESHDEYLQIVEYLQTQKSIAVTTDFMWYNE